ncbi:MAG: hypothetical protein DWB48_07880 [Nitrosomonas sp.]|nr:hypothetical protein [Nitrosomonas sp.]
MSGGGGGLIEVGINTFGPEGEGGSIPLRYVASYDISLYEDVMTVTIHECYWISGLVPPLLEAPTAGHSTLISTQSNGQQRKDILGNFEPGNIAYPGRLTSRDVPIFFIGQDNFPTQLVIRIVFGAENMAAKTVYYPLPNLP